MKRKYTPEELSLLHKYLYDILAEIIRVCEKCDIKYFIQGGTGIGAFFEQSILPWDDDIDVGMTRENYNKFLEMAPAVLKEGFFLQTPDSEPHTPFYFAKVRMDNTAFVEGVFKNLDIHHGIYVDVFPFDKVPDSPFWQRTHRAICNFFNGCFMGKTIWQWKHCGKCDIETPRKRGWFPCFVTRLFVTMFSKRRLNKMLCWWQARYNNKQTTYYNMVLMPRDHISVESIEHPQTVQFGPLRVVAPSDLETYLRHHYPNLRRYIPEEEQMNHRPEILFFDREHHPTNNTK